ncbi:MAG: hypothetical protein M3308_01320 [Actinomycetota bacterium]|nr:hypothetical protein [Actinomycetota bacterium]
MSCVERPRRLPSARLTAADDEAVEEVPGCSGECVTAALKAGALCEAGVRKPETCEESLRSHAAAPSGWASSPLGLSGT